VERDEVEAELIILLEDGGRAQAMLERGTNDCMSLALNLKTNGLPHKCILNTVVRMT
jgi:hypothetical protein